MGLFIAIWWIMNVIHTLVMTHSLILKMAIELESFPWIMVMFHTHVILYQRVGIADLVGRFAPWKIWVRQLGIWNSPLKQTKHVSKPTTSDICFLRLWWLIVSLSWYHGFHCWKSAIVICHDWWLLYIRIYMCVYISICVYWWVKMKYVVYRYIHCLVKDLS